MQKQLWALQIIYKYRKLLEKYYTKLKIIYWLLNNNSLM